VQLNELDVWLNLQYQDDVLVVSLSNKLLGVKSTLLGCAGVQLKHSPMDLWIQLANPISNVITAEIRLLLTPEFNSTQPSQDMLLPRFAKPLFLKQAARIRSDI